MNNLAGNQNCDIVIRRELQRARIPAVDVERACTEVPYSVIGKLGPFTFRRAWRYWVAGGAVPLDVARELYADEVGREDVRSGGDCACRPPETWADYFDVDGKILSVDAKGSDRASFRHMIEKGFLPHANFDEIHFVDSEQERDRLTARAIVTTYHIDSEVGLRLFVDTIRRHGLDRE